MKDIKQKIKDAIHDDMYAFQTGPRDYSDLEELIDKVIDKTLATYIKH